MYKTSMKFAFAALMVLFGGLQAALAFEVTDIAGRTVTLDKPAKTVVLGDGRVLSALAILNSDNPVAGIQAILSDLHQTDPVLLKYLEDRFPETADIPMLIGVETGASAEAVIARGADVAILSMSGHGPSVDDVEFVEQLQAAGIPVVFIDFRLHPFTNTVASLELMGKVLGREQQAEDFAEFYNSRKKLIESRLADYDGPRPTVFLQAHIGRFECCLGMAHGMLGPFVEDAGGRNISSEAVPGAVGRHTKEFLLAANPDIWIGTASGNPEDFEAGKPYAVLGMNVDEKLAEASAKRALESEGLDVLDAVHNGHAYTIWHGFYNSPFNIYVLEVFAKWFHPELFKDLDPEATFRKIHEEFLPLERPGIYSWNVAE